VRKSRPKWGLPSNRYEGAEVSRVLVADSDSQVREQIAVRLRQAGHLVQTVADGRSALQMARAGTADVVLVEMALALVSGLEVCRRLRAHSDTERLPVILVTNQGREVDVRAGEAAGVDDHIAKMFGLRDVARRVEAVLTEAAGALPVAA
jgi:DNA-binding response OmpR family regulator